MNSSTIIGIIVVIIIVIGGWYYYSQSSTTTNTATPGYTQTNLNPNGSDYSPASTTNEASSTDMTATSTATSTQAGENGGAVALSATGFSPKTITVAKGTTVTWTNTGTGPMWVASGVHPVHSAYDGTTKDTHCAAGYTGAKPFDECANGAVYSFTFDQTGTWQYHNHLNAAETGTVVVQ